MAGEGKEQEGGESGRGGGEVGRGRECKGAKYIRITCK